MKILSVTGTKGKTSVVRGISHVLHKLGEKTLRVDTDGHYINERKKSTYDDSVKLSMSAPTVCPGKYLITAKKMRPHFTAIFENSLGSNGKQGLGYTFHDVGIFTNVYEDHINKNGINNSKEALAETKSFIFKYIDKNGTAIYNYDDALIRKQLEKLPAKYPVSQIAVTLEKITDVEIKKMHSEDICFFTIENDWCLLVTKNERRKIIKTTDIYWTFGGLFVPSKYNLLFILAGLFALGKNIFSEKLLLCLKKYKLDSRGGRLTLLKNRKGVKILIDYAHEKQSLRSIGKLAKKLTAPGGVTLGVIRLAPDRADELIKETALFIAQDFDSFIVYDKIDGISRGRFVKKNSDLTREIGEVSEILAEAITEKNKNVSRVIYEKDAIKEASLKVRPGDVVVHICGDDHKNTVSWVKKYFKARRVA